MSKITKINAREILDSQGNPTIEAKIICDDGTSGRASVPSGVFSGIHGALELRDGDLQRYRGLGVQKAISNIEKIISPKLQDLDIKDQKKIDKKMIELDGTNNKKNLGANSILAVSIAAMRTSANAQKKSLYEQIAEVYNFRIKKIFPIPCFNIFNGGRHADTNLDFQEFMIIPVKTSSFSEQLRMGAEIFHELGSVLKEGGLDTDVGSEGGYAPDIRSSIQAIELILASILRAGYHPGKDVGIGIDVGSSQLYNKNSREYIFRLDNTHFTRANLIGLYNEWFRKYPILLIEDGAAYDDWEGWRELSNELGNEILLVGDDLFFSDKERLKIGIKENSANSILIKPNQIGTITETVDCIKLAQKNKYKIIISHRSGETCDDFIADLAVAVGADFIKAGSLARSERLVKYNRLMEIEQEIKK